MRRCPLFSARGTKRLDEHDIETAYLLGELGLADALLASMATNAPVSALIADALQEVVNGYPRVRHQNGLFCIPAEQPS